MIKIAEIQQKARSVFVRDQQIEKDYILSWILKGISMHKHLSKVLVFKGGTVLKKIYFVDYRFSEDLDFTLFQSEASAVEILNWFNEIFEFVKEEANIPLQIIHNTEHETGGINFYINYIGPLGGQGNNKKVKVDISINEILIFEPIWNGTFIEYSDLDNYKILCYPLAEILIEKMRSVMQRMQARDFYDIWYLLEEHQMDILYYMNEFKAKCQSKGLNHSDFIKKLSERIPQYKGRWNSSLSEQINELPVFDKVEREVQRHIKRLKF
jgi:predicted nucleotidyltransferase component of viral defense system